MAIVRARALMTKEVHCVLPETPLVDAWKIMHTHGVHHLPVVRDGKLIGMLSDRDFLGWAERNRDGSLVFSSSTAGHVMSLNPVVAISNTGVRELAQTMRDNRLNALPIVAADNHLIGMVTSTDLVALLLEPRKRELPYTFRLTSASEVA